MRPSRADIGEVFNALADPTRRGVVELLCSRPHRASEMAKHFGLSAPAMSRHLRLLRQHRLIEQGPPLPEDARVRPYRLRRERFDGLQGWLDEVKQVWSQQLDAFKHYAESLDDGALDEGSRDDGRDDGGRDAP